MELTERLHWWKRDLQNTRPEMRELAEEQVPRYERALREGRELEFLAELEAEGEAIARSLSKQPHADDIDPEGQCFPSGKESAPDLGGQAAPTLDKQTLPKDID
jgi:hypothetical protein